MRVLLSTIFICCFALLSFAQESEPEADIVAELASSRDRLILELNYTGLANPTQALETKWFSRGANIYFTYDFPIGDSKHFSFAPGIGFSFHNAYTNSAVVTEEVGEVARYTYFKPISDEINFSKNKFNTNFIEVPLELRFHTNPDNNGRSFKVGLGFRGGRIISSKTKYRGDQITNGVVEVVKIKTLEIPNTYKYRYGPSLRIGYGEISFVAFYSMSGIFDENFGPDIRPFSIGISFNSF